MLREDRQTHLYRGAKWQNFASTKHHNENPQEYNESTNKSKKKPTVNEIKVRVHINTPTYIIITIQFARSFGFVLFKYNKVNELLAFKIILRSSLFLCLPFFCNMIISFCNSSNLMPTRSL